MKTSPTSLRELIAYLEAHPRVTIIGIRGERDDCRYLDHTVSGLWFATVLSDGSTSPDTNHRHFLPVNCRLGAAAESEAGVAFEPGRFTLTKFGYTICVDYREDIEP